MTGPRRLGTASPAPVAAGRDGLPVRVKGRAVEGVLEDWVVEDRWWTGRPLRRRYVELVLEGGRCVVVFRDLEGGRWYVQRA